MTMRFSILHISDLHRDLNDEIDNTWLLESLGRDIDQYDRQAPAIVRPSLCIASGDLVYGVGPDAVEADKELERQYEQAEQFLVGLADRFFDGDREKVIVLPGNHDVAYAEVMSSATRIEIPVDLAEKKALVDELFQPQSRIRWSWKELCFYRITDQERYRNRIRHFTTTHDRFYQGRRTYSLVPEQQYDLFDFPDFGLCILSLNSCYNNDPLRRAGAFHPGSIASASEALRHVERTGRLLAATWHHSLSGGPEQDDYLDLQVLQLLIDVGVSLGFHGHQHWTNCVDERYRIGEAARKMTIISAGTLCAGPRNLTPGIPRSYNVVELDTTDWVGRVHQRKMVNQLFNMPVWGPGHFESSNRSFIDFELCKPITGRPVDLDAQILLSQAETMLGSRRWNEALNLLEKVKDVPLARPLLSRALEELDDATRTIATLWPPATFAEAVAVGGAILKGGTREQAEAFVTLSLVAANADASVTEIVRRIRERRLR